MADETLPATQPPERRREVPVDIVASERGFVPRNIDEVLRYARMLLVAGAVPDSLAKEGGSKLPDNEVVARVVAVIAAGSEIGMGPMSAMANIALINKRRLIWGQGAIAVLQASGQLEDMRVDHIGQSPGDGLQTAQFNENFGIRVTLKRKGQPTPFVGEFTVGQARRAHLWLNTNKKPWIEHPERMLFWRAFNNAASIGFGDCLAGLGIRELADEVPPTQITDTSFLDAPKREEVVPDTKRDRPTSHDNEQPPVEPGGDPPPQQQSRRRRRSKEEVAMDMFRPDHRREEVVPDTPDTGPDKTEPPADTGGDREREPGEEG